MLSMRGCELTIPATVGSLGAPGTGGGIAKPGGLLPDGATAATVAGGEPRNSASLNSGVAASPPFQRVTVLSPGKFEADATGHGQHANPNADAPIKGCRLTPISP